MNNEVVRDELVRRQGSRSGREFARLLGISESYWSLVRRGERPITPALLERALKEFPDLLRSNSIAGAPRQSDRAPSRPIWAWKHFRLLVNLGLTALIIGTVAFSQFTSGDDYNGATVAAMPLEGGHHPPVATPTRTPRPLAHHAEPTKTPTPRPPTRTPFAGCPSGFTPETGNPTHCIPI
jgi:hypothetical protein